MLSDSLRENVPTLLGMTYDYLCEKERFDYGSVGQRLAKTFAELIVLSIEIDQGYLHESAGKSISATPIFQLFAKGDYFGVIDKYWEAFADERAKFKPLFDFEMKKRAEISTEDMEWVTPEMCVRKKRVPMNIKSSGTRP